MFQIGLTALVLTLPVHGALPVKRCMHGLGLVTQRIGRLIDDSRRQSTTVHSCYVKITVPNGRQSSSLTVYLDVDADDRTVGACPSCLASAFGFGYSTIERSDINMAMAGTPNSEPRLRSTENSSSFDIITSPLPRTSQVRQFLTAAPTNSTRVFRVAPMKPGDQLVLHSAPDGSWVHPGAVIPVRGVADIESDWPVYDPWTGVRTAGVLGGCMLLVVLYILYKTRCVGRVGGASKRRWTSKDRLFVEKYKRKVQERCSTARNMGASTQRGTVASIVDALHPNANYPQVITRAASPNDRKHILTSSNSIAVNFSASKDTSNCDVRVHERPTSACSFGAVADCSQLVRPSSAEPLSASVSTPFAERSSCRSVSVDASSSRRIHLPDGSSSPRSSGGPSAADVKVYVDAESCSTACSISRPLSVQQETVKAASDEATRPQRRVSVIVAPIVLSGPVEPGLSASMAHDQTDRGLTTDTKSDFAAVTNGIRRLCRQFSSSGEDNKTPTADSNPLGGDLDGHRPHNSGMNVRWRSLVDFTTSETPSGERRRIDIEEILPPTTNV